MMRQHDNELHCIEESLKHKLSHEALKKPIEEIESVKAQLNNFR
jgi:hypothetical protein